MRAAFPKGHVIRTRRLVGDGPEIGGMIPTVDLHEALARLGLRDGASREDIEVAYLEKMKIVHPDSGSARDADVARELNVARDVARAATTSTALVPLDAAPELVRAATSAPLKEIRRREASEKAVRQVVTHQVGHLAEHRRRLTGLAAVSAGLAIATPFLRSAAAATFKGGAPAGFVYAIAVFTVLAAILALTAWGISTREQMLKLEVEDAADTVGAGARSSRSLRRSVSTTRGRVTSSGPR